MSRQRKSILLRSLGEVAALKGRGMAEVRLRRERMGRRLGRRRMLSHHGHDAEVARDALCLCLRGVVACVLRLTCLFNRDSGCLSRRLRAGSFTSSDVPVIEESEKQSEAADGVGVVVVGGGVEWYRYLSGARARVVELDRNRKQKQAPAERVLDGCSACWAARNEPRCSLSTCF